MRNRAQNDNRIQVQQFKQKINIKVDINPPSIQKRHYKNYHEHIKFCSMRLYDPIAYILGAIKQYPGKIPPNFCDDYMVIHQIINIEKQKKRPQVGNQEMEEQPNYDQYGLQLNEAGQLYKNVTTEMRVKHLHLQSLKHPDDYILLRVKWQALSVHVIGIKDDLGIWMIDPNESFQQFINRTLQDYNSQRIYEYQQIYLSSASKFVFLVGKTIYRESQNLSVLKQVYEKSGKYTITLRVQIVN